MSETRQFILYLLCFISALTGVYTMVDTTRTRLLVERFIAEEAGK